MIDNNSEVKELRNEVMDHKFAKPEMQEARAFLRERFLRVVTGIVGKFFDIDNRITFRVKDVLHIHS